MGELDMHQEAMGKQLALLISVFQPMLVLVLMLPKPPLSLMLLILFMHLERNKCDAADTLMLDHLGELTNGGASAYAGPVMDLEQAMLIDPEGIASYSYNIVLRLGDCS